MVLESDSVWCVSDVHTDVLKSITPLFSNIRIVNL
jgi:hypothetical protein